MPRAVEPGAQARHQLHARGGGGERAGADRARGPHVALRALESVGGVQDRAALGARGRDHRHARGGALERAQEGGRHVAGAEHDGDDARPRPTRRAASSRRPSAASPDGDDVDRRAEPLDGQRRPPLRPAGRSARAPSATRPSGPKPGEANAITAVESALRTDAGRVHLAREADEHAQPGGLGATARRRPRRAGSPARRRPAPTPAASRR